MNAQIECLPSTARPLTDGLHRIASSHPWSVLSAPSLFAGGKHVAQ